MSSSGGIKDTEYLSLSPSLALTSHGTFSTLSPSQVACNLPNPASLVSKPRLKGDPDSTVPAGPSISLTLSAAFPNMFSLNGLPLTWLPPHLMLNSYMSGSGGVKDTLYLSSSFCFTVTGTSPTLLPTHVASKLPPPAPEVSKSKSIGTPDSSTLSGSATISTFSASAGRRLIL